jgi:hypothetical protein
MLPAGFKPAIPKTELPQTYAIDLTATGIGLMGIEQDEKSKFFSNLPVQSVAQERTTSKIAVDTKHNIK